MTAQNQNAQIGDRAVDEAKADIVGVIGRYVELKREGPEYTAPCPFHSEKSPSFKVNPVKGFYHCFGCGANGDAIDFVMNFEGVKFPQAVERIVGAAAIKASGPALLKGPKKAQREPDWRPVRYAPQGAEPTPADLWHSRLGDPVKTWTYRDFDGVPVGYVSRYEVAKPGGGIKKETLPLTWAVNTETGEQSWRFIGFGVPRPLYGMEKLKARPGRQVLVVEGEKTTDAAQLIFKGFNCVSWPGGGNAVDVAFWDCLEGLDVTLWGDWDAKVYKESHEKAGQLMPEGEQPGTLAQQKIYLHLRSKAKRLRFVKPLAGAPDGWDLADAPPCDGWDALEYARASVVLASDYFEPKEPVQAAEDAPAAMDDGGPEYEGPPAKDGAIDFPAPLDVFGIQRPPELPIDVLPRALQQYTKDQADLTGCDPGIIGMGALVAAAACLTDQIKIQPKRHDPTWTESARLWVAFVGDPSTKKSPAISKAVRHLKRLDYGMSEENEKTKNAFLRQHADWKDAKKADKNLASREPKPPAINRLLVEDITVEALTEVLRDNARGVMTLKDELTGWFASMDAYKGGGKGASMDRAHWLEAYNGGRRTIDRVSRGAVVVPNWSTCIIGGIQPDMIRRVASSMGNDGLLQRFMVYCARPATEDADRHPDMAAMDDFGALFDSLIGLKGTDAHVVKLGEEAHQSRERVARYAKRLIGAIDHGHLQAWLGKWDGLYARLLLLYHALASVDAKVHPMNMQVSGQTAEQVERLMCAVLLPHAMHFYGEIVDANDRQEHIRQLARMILAKKTDRLTKRDIAINWRASRRLEAWEMRAIVDALCTMGWLEPDRVTVDSDGKPRAWHVNPAVHEAFTKYAERETERRREAIQALRELREAYGTVVA